MLFNSVEFAIFLPIVFGLYWFVTNKRLGLQNLLLLAASYLFYGFWDWRFLGLIFFSSFLDYFIGLRLDKESSPLNRKVLLGLSLAVNFGFLLYFKYYNFFAESFAETFTLLGYHFDVNRLNILLPVGISFYTFQTLSYSIDIYQRKLKPSKDIVAFFAFVSFFPQLVAGPIERAKNLLPQFYKKRKFEYQSAADGMRQILWGLFKKMVIADNCAVYVNDIFANYNDYSSTTLLLGGVLFAFQIYGDFSGYSDIAIGTARLFGFNLMQNFAFPYFSRDIAEFWRRWHISLSTWFRDYLYIPLGGSRGSKFLQIRNIFIIFLVSGFWHGANWTYVVWGGINACFFLPLLISKNNRNHLNIVAEHSSLPNLKEVFQILTTFFLSVIAWIFFRADNLSHAIAYLKRLFLTLEFDLSLTVHPELIVSLILLLVIEWMQRREQHGLAFNLDKVPVFYRWAIYSIVIGFILTFEGKQQEFIYFQF